MKLCSCGFANSDDAGICLACGAPLGSEVATTAEMVGGTVEHGRDEEVLGASLTVSARCERTDAQDSHENPTASLILESMSNPGCIPVRIPAPGGIIGRAGDFSPEVFSARVSGIHAKVTSEDGHWTIEHLGRNRSYVLRAGVWMDLPRGRGVGLLNGDQLRLADMLFRVVLEQSQVEQLQEEQPQAECLQASQPQAEDEQADTTAETVEQWVVVCPVCGARYPVEDENGRISQCDVCIDTLDKRQIAVVSARRENASA